MSPNERQKRGPGFGVDDYTSTCFVQGQHFKTFMLAERSGSAPPLVGGMKRSCLALALLCSFPQTLKIEQAKRRK